jgi:hypothetical protein
MSHSDVHSFLGWDVLGCDNWMSRVRTREVMISFLPERTYTLHSCNLNLLTGIRFNITRAPKSTSNGCIH